MTWPSSFFVGGRELLGADGSAVLVDQMYVRQYGAGRAGLAPVLMLHGGAQTGEHWEHTPDGRPGLAPLLAASGRAVYVVDLPGVGRSRYHPDAHGPLAHYSTEFTAALFTAPGRYGLWPGAELHTQWPGLGTAGDPTFDAFYAGQVGRLDDEVVERVGGAAGAALLDRLGRCHLITHSQAGPVGWHIADQRPNLVASVIALEPKGPPFFDPRTDPTTDPLPERRYGLTVRPLTYQPAVGLGRGLPYVIDRECGAQQTEPARQLVNLARVPVVLMTAEASYHAHFDHYTAEYLRRAGVQVEHVLLADHGLTGNGHLMAVECNNSALADLVEKYLGAAERQ